MAVASLVRNVPAAFAAPLTGLVGDRYPRLRVMIGADLIRGAAMFLGAATIALDGRPRSSSRWHR